MLNQMREGRLDSVSISKFKALNRPLNFTDGIEATELFSTRREVDEANRQRLGQLPTPPWVFDATDGGSVEKGFRDKLLANVMAPSTITLKTGAQVMLIKNYDDTLVNGSLGKVIGFMTTNEFSSYHDDDEAYLASQSVGAEVPDHKQTIAELATKTKGSANRFPVVRFAIADGTTRDMLCHQEQWSVEQPNGEIQASRSQVPLILAWALSIHKAQGQTLERVKVNLSKAFERGQAYVALSRATTMHGLQVIGFDPAKVMAHDAVKRFYASLSRADESVAAAKDVPRVPGAYPVEETAKKTYGSGGAEISYVDDDEFDDMYDEDF
jgi:ATP-dependent DNA helicase PIF1